MTTRLHPHQHDRYRRMPPILWLFAALQLLAALLLDSPGNILRGLRTIVFTEDALITDYIAVAGPGAALVNAALVTAITLCLLYFSNETFNGITQLEIGLMSGFALFGKNFVNIWPILAGSWLYARFPAGALGHLYPHRPAGHRPVPCGQLYCPGQRLGNVYSAVAVGVLIGFIMPPCPPIPTASKTA
ncbi:MAG: DUF1576 domain-containing protein [Lawsonibacter sp.]